MEHGRWALLFSVILFLNTDFLKAQRPSVVEIRLVGPNAYEGRVEVRRNSSEPWGSLCYRHGYGIWNKWKTIVVCHQLNLGHGRLIASEKAGDRTMYMKNLECDGTESSLASCTYDAWQAKRCDSDSVVAVHCQPLNCSGPDDLGDYCSLTQSEDLEVRLVGGPKRGEGVLEVQRNNGDWLKVCADHHFNDKAMRVVCQQLNLGDSGIRMSSSQYSTNATTVFLDAIDCIGSETNLGHCGHRAWGIDNCGPYPALAILCGHLPEIRLVGPNAYEGRVEVRSNSSEPWGSLCTGTGFWKWSKKKTTVVCRQLNLGHGKVKASEKAGNRTMYMDGLLCSGLESSLASCYYHTWQHRSCSSNSVVAVHCQPLNCSGADDPGEHCSSTHSEVSPSQLTTRASSTATPTLSPSQLTTQASSTATPTLSPSQLTTRASSTATPTLSPSQLTTRASSTATPTLSPSQLTTQASSTATPTSATTRPLPESHKTRILQNLTESEVGRKQLAQFKDVLQQQGQTVAADVVHAAMFVDRASQLSNISTQVATDLLKIVDTVAELNQSVLQESNSVGNMTNRLIAAVEQLADRVSLEEGQVHLQTNSTVLQVWNLSSISPSPFLSLQLCSDGDIQNVTSVTSLSDSDTYTNVDTAIFLPGVMGRNIAEQNPDRDVRLSASVTQQTGLFQVDSNTDSPDTDSQDTDRSQDPTTGEGARGGVSLDSKVASLRISVDGQPVSNLSAFGQGNVTIVFTPLQPVAEKAEAAEQVEQGEGWQCVFWDFALRQGRGGWSGRGCYLEAVVEDKVKCVCDHLANFGILMFQDLWGQVEKVDIVHERILSPVTMTGLILSIGGLALTLLAFLLVRHLQKSLPHQTLFNMALSMLLSWLTFLAGIERVESPMACVAVAMLLHYFILVSFLWMLARGILQFFMLVKARPRPFTRFMLKAGLLAWVIVVSAVDVELYRGGQRYCWMSQTPFYYTFLVPVALIVAINVVIYVLVVASLCCRPNLGTEGPGYTTISIRASISCFVVLGLSWIFAFFTLGEAGLVFQYLFTCTAALQGLLIFVLYTARDPAVRAFLRRVRAQCNPPANDAEKPPSVQLEMRAIAN